MKQALVAHPDDTVATALHELSVGDSVSAVVKGGEPRIVSVHEHVPRFHKLALRDIGLGEKVLKYGEAIGRASQAIGVGRHVHVHNLDSERGRGDRV